MTERIVILDHDTLGADVVLRRPKIPHTWTVHGRTAADAVVERAADATVLVVNKVPLGADTIARLPHLRFVAVAATGTDTVDLAACRARGIVVSNVQGYAVHTVPEHVFALLLSLRRSLPAYRESVAAGAWQAGGQFTLLSHPIRDLHGATLGIAGFGAIGQAVGRIAEAFGMRVIRAGRKGADTDAPGIVPFHRFLAESDVITLHCPLTPATRHLLDDDAFARMERRPLVINTARGALIDDAALVRALTGGLISGAAVDATAVEPPAPDHPFMALAGRPDFLLTPHIGWASREARQAVADQVTAAIGAFAAGSPINRAA
ncbi:glycerate dehydrogenase [Azospirillum fermentarium]|uniref:D-2-hydroxyacid dehydrogenase n=1 Tax=Azospirillum fermentarium TaxID=1233114 RepID=UPI0022273354|nr:D-2-hydroxyacid dehydrogenase [Azospirillum fermentarium]MCW2249366.1 glycerate dehydrogenase [Azospirillum fermentarium]